MIGLFDSGSGGLSVLDALRARAPQADIAYFGDIAHAPYGVRSQTELTALTIAGISTLKNMGATEVVSACNSVSPAVLTGAAGDVPAIEMTMPTIKSMQKFRGKRVLLIATPATIVSKIYARLKEWGVLESLPIAELAGAIEFGASDEKLASILQRSFAAQRGAAYDILLLGCTHYPLIRDQIELEARVAFGKIECVDPAEFVADEVVRTFDCKGAGAMHFAISKESQEFRKRVSGLFPAGGYTIDVP